MLYTSYGTNQHTHNVWRFQICAIKINQWVQEESACCIITLCSTKFYQNSFISHWLPSCWDSILRIFKWWFFFKCCNSFWICKLKVLLIINPLSGCSANESGYKHNDIKHYIQCWLGDTERSLVLEIIIHIRTNEKALHKLQLA